MNTEQRVEPAADSTLSAEPPPRTFRDWFATAVGWGTGVVVVLLLLFPRRAEGGLGIGWPIVFYVDPIFQPLGSGYTYSSGFSGVALLLDLISLPVMCTITVVGAQMVARRQFSLKQMMLFVVAIAVVLGIFQSGRYLGPRIESSYSPPFVFPSGSRPGE